MFPSQAPDSLRRNLQWLQETRGRDAQGRMPARLIDVKAWQAGRLASTYADLAANPRYAKATAFFLGDLYGAKDFSGRDDAMLRMYPAMVRTLPRGAVESVAMAIEVDALSEALDRRVASVLAPGPIHEATYVQAYRDAGTRQEREHQIALIENLGKRLDMLVVKPLIGSALRLMRGPARLAGMEDLQAFLERGFEAFRHMNGADDFLATISSRESAILNRIFSGHPRPISG